MIVLGAGRRDGLHAAWPGAAANPIDEIDGLPELALHHRPADQRVVHRQHADRRRCSARTARLAFTCSSEYVWRLCRSKVSVTGPVMRRQRNQDAAGRIAAAHHVAEGAPASHADAERRRTGHLRRDLLVEAAALARASRWRLSRRAGGSSGPDTTTAELRRPGTGPQSAACSQYASRATCAFYVLRSTCVVLFDPFDAERRCGPRRRTTRTTHVDVERARRV